MAPDEPAKPGPVLLRIKLRYDDVETMVQRFAPNVGKAGLFLPTKTMQPIGAEVKFELKLANDTPVIVGLGRVKHVRPADPENPKAIAGLGVELMRVTRESRDVIMKMLDRRRQLGLAETAVPTADEIEAARRDIDTGVRAPTPAPVMLEPQSEPLLTAPRRSSGPIAVQKLAEDVVETSRPVAMPAALAPEPSRRHVRRSLDELIASASPAASITADMFGSSDEIDVHAVLARARTLAAGSGDLDAELDALRESSAAPIEISVEAASAELARALGGVAVSRKPRGSWAVPPPTAPAPAVTEVDPEPTPPPQLQKSVAAIAIAALAEDLGASAFAEDEPDQEVGDDLVEEEDEDPRAGYIRDEEPEPEAAPVAHEHRAAEAVAEALAAEPEPEHDEPLAFVPSMPEEIITEPRNDALGSGLLIDDDVDPSVFESGGDTAGPSVENQPEEFSLDQPTQFAVLPMPDIDGNERLDAALAQAEATGDVDEDFGFPSEPIEEIDDFEILAEDDVEADDLVADIGPRDHTEGDFVARLELSNEHSAIADDPLSGFRERDSAVSFGDDPLAGFDAAPPQAVWDPTTGQYVYPDQPVYAAPPIEGDLEDALEALDVDLDELGGPQPAQPRGRMRTPSRPVQAPRAKSEDDGILIDFDDDD